VASHITLLLKPAHKVFTIACAMPISREDPVIAFVDEIQFESADEAHDARRIEQSQLAPPGGGSTRSSQHSRQKGRMARGQNRRRALRLRPCARDETAPSRGRNRAVGQRTAVGFYRAKLAIGIRALRNCPHNSPSA